MTKKIVVGFVVVLVLIQFIRPAKNKGAAQTPQDISHVVTVPEPTLQLLQRACYDCHSNQTAYPWYAEVNPVGWWLNHHVKEGKEELNFSAFAQYNAKRRDHKLKEIAKTIQEHEMPLPSYLWMHPEARLTDAERRQIIDWAHNARQQLAGR